MKHRVSYWIDDNEKIHMSQMHVDLDGIMREYARAVCDTKDKAVIEALTGLGWTPPKEKDQNEPVTN